MIEIVNSQNAQRHQDLLDRQFRLRHDIFVKERGWTEFDVNGTHERDQYDNENATYLIASDDDSGIVAGGFRVYPTVLPHMITDVFAHLVESTMIQRSDVFELTRFGMRKSERRSRHYFELLTAIHEFGLIEGLSGFTMVINPLRIPVLQGFGLEIEPLGLPAPVNGDPTIAVLVHIDEQICARVRHRVSVHNELFGGVNMSRKIA